METKTHNPAYFGEWETGECTDKDVIYLNLKGMNDRRFSHFHLNKQDVEVLINDLQRLINNKDERLFLKIKHDLDH